jgi:tetratricopeptide (TPR) repeat protein
VRRCCAQLTYIPNQIASVVWNNKAAIRLTQELKDEALECCTKSLALWPQNCKALLRRARTNAALQNLPAAIADFKMLLASECIVFA